MSDGEYMKEIAKNPRLFKASKNALNIATSEKLEFETTTGLKVPLYSNKVYSQGSSISHLAESFSDSEEFLMVPAIPRGETIDDLMARYKMSDVYGKMIQGVLESIGYETVNNKKQLQLQFAEDFGTDAYKPPKLSKRKCKPKTSRNSTSAASKTQAERTRDIIAKNQVPVTVTQSISAETGALTITESTLNPKSTDTFEDAEVPTLEQDILEEPVIDNDTDENLIDPIEEGNSDEISQDIPTDGFAEEPLVVDQEVDETEQNDFPTSVPGGDGGAILSKATTIFSPNRVHFLIFVLLAQFL